MTPTDIAKFTSYLGKRSWGSRKKQYGKAANEYMRRLAKRSAIKRAIKKKKKLSTVVS